MNKMEKKNKAEIAPIAPKLWYSFNPPYLMCTIGGGTYKVEPDGTTFLMAPGMEHGFPVSECPIAERLMWANFQFFLYRNRKVWPALIVALAFLVLLQWFLWLIPDSPMTDAKLSFLALFSFWMNTALVAGPCIVVIAFFLFEVWGAFSYTATDLMPEPGQIAQGYSIGKDVPVFSASPMEHAQDFKARVIEARNNLKDNQWIVVIAFKNPSGLLVKKGPSLNEPYSSKAFYRNEPPFTGMQIEKGYQFKTETWEQYEQYLQEFCFLFQDFAKNAKIREGDPLEQYIETI